MADDVLCSRIHVGGHVLDEEMHEWWEGFGAAKHLRTCADYWLQPADGGPRSYLGSVHTSGKRGHVVKAWTCRPTTPTGGGRVERADVGFLLPPFAAEGGAQ